MQPALTYQKPMLNTVDKISICSDGLLSDWKVDYLYSSDFGYLSSYLRAIVMAKNSCCPVHMSSGPKTPEILFSYNCETVSFADFSQTISHLREHFTGSTKLI